LLKLELFVFSWKVAYCTPSYHCWPGINDIIRDQDLVGWRAFLKGAALHEWVAKQQEYYEWTQHKYHREMLDHNTYQETLEDIMEYVGTTQRRATQPRIISITART
jgi:hypothetical protein